MIKINLLGEEANVDHSGKFMLMAYGASVAACIGLFFLLLTSLNSKIESATREAEQLETRLARLKETTKEVRDLEAKKEELNKKLIAIATLKKNKVGPVRVMDDLNNAVPEKAWLSDVNERAGIMRLIGFALDNQTIAAFMKELESSDYFQKVDLVETKLSEHKGAKIKNFTLQASINYAGRLIPEDPAVKEAEGAANKSAALNDGQKTSFE